MIQNISDILERPEFHVISVSGVIVCSGLILSIFLEGFNRRRNHLIKAIPYIVTLIMVFAWLIYGFTHLNVVERIMDAPDLLKWIRLYKRDKVISFKIEERYIPPRYNGHESSGINFAQKLPHLHLTFEIRYDIL